jgi:UTP--glucose-1-phosphate uridylyltransferase
MEINGPEISNYGVVVINKQNQEIIGLLEKPSFENAPSNLASIGRYILTPDIFDILRKQSFGALGEIQLSDAINSQAALGAVETLNFNGNRFDCGNVSGYVNAILHMAEGKDNN